MRRAARVLAGLVTLTMSAVGHGEAADRNSPLQPIASITCSARDHSGYQYVFPSEQPLCHVFDLAKGADAGKESAATDCWREISLHSIAGVRCCYSPDTFAHDWTADLGKMPVARDENAKPGARPTLRLSAGQVIARCGE